MARRPAQKAAVQFEILRLTMRFVTFLTHKTKSTIGPNPGFRICPDLAIHTAAGFCFTYHLNRIMPQLEQLPAQKQNPGPYSARGMNPSSSKIIIVRFRGEVNVTLRRSPVRDLLATFPTRTGKAVDPAGFEPAPWNMTGSCAADYTTGPEATLGVGRAARKCVRYKRH